MKTSKFTDRQIISILIQSESGTPVAPLCCEHGMSNAMLLSINGVPNMVVWIHH